KASSIVGCCAGAHRHRRGADSSVATVTSHGGWDHRRGGSLDRCSGTAIVRGFDPVVRRSRNSFVATATSIAG
ncbi:MAG: hypothetical protein AAFU77_18395, partial [Myxococcota bacterium]